MWNESVRCRLLRSSAAHLEGDDARRNFFTALELF
jgi:hypothetical protein